MKNLYQRNPRKGARTNLKLVSGRKRSEIHWREQHPNFWAFILKDENRFIADRRFDLATERANAYVLWTTGRQRFAERTLNPPRFNRGKYWRWGK